MTSKSVEAGWQEMPSPTTEQIYFLTYINQSTGFLGSQGSIYKTTNGGLNWHQTYQGNLTPKAVSFVGGSGYAACYNNTTFGGDVLYTTNLGESWIIVQSLSNDNGFTGVSTKLPLEAFFTTWDGMVLHTTNGLSWADTLLHAPYLGMWDLQIVNNSFVTCSTNGIYMQTSSGWQHFYHGIDCFGGMTIVNPVTIYVAGSSWLDNTPAISYTTNRGVNWTVQEFSGDTGHVRSVVVVGNEAYAVGQYTGGGRYLDCIWKRVDDTWMRDSLFYYPSGSFGFFKVYAFFNEIYIIGAGKLYKKLSSVTSVSQQHETPQFILKQNYPNPFNPTTKIGFQVKKNTFVTLKVYDGLGKEVTTLVDAYKSLGFYSVEFNATNLPSGIYYYVIKADGISDVKKMMLVK